MNDSTTSPSRQLIAPLWHTALLIALLILIVLIQKEFNHRVWHRLTTYIVAILIELFLIGVVIFGLRLRHTPLRQIIARNWRKPLWILRDLGIAILFLVVSNIILRILARFLHPIPTRALINLVPQTLPEMACWVALSATAGVCEEIIFRGYLQRQFTIITGNTMLGIVIQAILFGVIHSYQGNTNIIIIGVFGFFFGLLAHWRRSLLPGMTAHAMQDAIAGLVLFLRR